MVYIMNTAPREDFEEEDETLTPEPMLNINNAMGFKPILHTCTWQGELATVRARLGV